MERYTQTLRIQRCILGEVEHEVTVKNINGKYHCRVFTNGNLNQEAVCYNQEAVCYSKLNIGYTCRSLLRWEDKCGNFSEFAGAARKRLNEQFI